MVVGRFIQIIELQDHERRIAALEQARGKRDAKRQPSGRLNFSKLRNALVRKHISRHWQPQPSFAGRLYLRTFSRKRNRMTRTRARQWRGCCSYDSQYEYMEALFEGEIAEIKKRFKDAYRRLFGQLDLVFDQSPPGASFDGLIDGVRESAQSWKELLLDLKRRGLAMAPKLAIADGALGFWQAIEEVWPQTRGQRCWVHKTANVLNKLPKSQQSKAKRALQEIRMAETKKDALAAFDVFVETWGVKYDKAVDLSPRIAMALLAFYEFPAEHWKHLRRPTSSKTRSPPCVTAPCARRDVFRRRLRSR